MKDDDMISDETLKDVLSQLAKPQDNKETPETTGEAENEERFGGIFSAKDITELSSKWEYT